MIACLIGTSVGIAFGWYGHKTSLRIAAWGEKADERDSIFQALSQPDEVGWPDKTYKRGAESALPVRTVRNHHLATPAASSK